jgi:hypothetical protein
MLSHQYNIKNWYAIGTTPTGQKILEHLGFKEVVSLDNGERKGYTLRNLLKSRTVQQFMDEMEHKDLLLSDQRTKFMMATPDDILDEYNLATSIFGDAVHDVPTRRAWLARNPGTDFIVRDRDQLVSFLNLLPVKHNTIMKFMRGEIRGWDIPAEDILPYTPNSEVECIVMGMATTPEAPPNKRTQYGRRLISGVAQFLRELAVQNIVVTKLYATSSTPTGIAILRDAKFQEIGQIGKRIAFEFDMMTATTPLAIKYREAIEKDS